MTMKLKLATFEIRSRSQTLPDFTSTASVMFQCASEILKDEIKLETKDTRKALTLRLMGPAFNVPISKFYFWRDSILKKAKFGPETI